MHEINWFRCKGKEVIESINAGIKRRMERIQRSRNTGEKSGSRKDKSWKIGEGSVTELADTYIHAYLMISTYLPHHQSPVTSDVPREQVPLPSENQLHM
jgi:hypothetical protein